MVVILFPKQGHNHLIVNPTIFQSSFGVLYPELVECAGVFFIDKVQFVQEYSWDPEKTSSISGSPTKSNLSLNE